MSTFLPGTISQGPYVNTAVVHPDLIAQQLSYIFLMNTWSICISRTLKVILKHPTPQSLECTHCGETAFGSVMHISGGYVPASRHFWNNAFLSYCNLELTHSPTPGLPQCSENCPPTNQFPREHVFQPGQILLSSGLWAGGYTLSIFKPLSETGTKDCEYLFQTFLCDCSYLISCLLKQYVVLAYVISGVQGVCMHLHNDNYKVA